jgi:hypothetical protein
MQLFALPLLCALFAAGCTSAPSAPSAPRAHSQRADQPAAARSAAIRTQAAAAAPASAPAGDLTFTWAGDITMGSRYGLPPGRGDTMFAGVRRQIAASDVAWGNLEGVLATGGLSKCGSQTANCYAFEAPPRLAGALMRAGFDGMNLANNHAHDFGDQALGQTRHALTAVHVRPSGGSGEITYVRSRGRRIAIVGFASYSWSSDITNIPAARRLTAEAARHADLVVVIFHGGAEGSDKVHVPRAAEYAFGENRGNLRAFSHAVVAAGADLVVGSGPHVLRGIEVYHHRLIAYSLGNFAGNGNFSTGGPLSLSGLLTVRLTPDGSLAGGTFTSISLDSHPWPRIDRTHAAADLVRRVSREDFGAGAARISSSGRIAAG